MSTVPSPAPDPAFEEIRKALEDEDFELLSEATGDFIRSYERPNEKDLDA